MSFWSELTGLFEKRLELECPSCKKSITVPPNSLGKLCRCSSCRTLFKIPKEPLRGLISSTADRLASKFEKMREQRARRRQAEDEMVNALEMVMVDGAITPDEERHLLMIARRHGIDPDTIQEMRAKYARGKYRQVIADNRVTPDEERRMMSVCRSLGVQFQSIVHNSAKYERMRLLGALSAGEVPIITAPSVFLKSGEVCHYEGRAGLLDERVIDRYFVGASSGWSFRICRGVSYRIGSFRGRPVVQRGVVEVDHGTFFITSQRFIYSGMKKTITIAARKIVDLDLYSDAIAIKAEGRVNTVTIKISDPELVGAVASIVVNRQD